MEATDEFALENGVWKRAFEGFDKNNDSYVEWRIVLIADVPVRVLLNEWEDLVCELSQKETELLKLKEYIQSESSHLETTVDFKEIYGKNNADVRKHHIKQELGDVYGEITSLELGINWIKQYIPLLRECIKVKSD